MGEQTDYETEKAKWWKQYHKKVVCGADDHRYWFDRIFAAAYHYGVRTGVAAGIEEFKPSHIPDATKKVDRAMIAAMAMQGLLNATSVERFSLRIKPESIAEAAVEYADALIDELNKTEQ